MPKNNSIKKVLVIGSGPIVIGQAAEFDYAGTQACRSLKEEGIEVVLVNSNPATIMTDKQIADKVYIEPLTTEVLKKIIKKEEPDSILPTLGGQAALNLAMELEENQPFFVAQPMQRLRLPQPVDACVCALDSINYVTKPQDVQKTFCRIYESLRPGGLFVFDINTPYKLESLDGQVFLDETEDSYCVWRAVYDRRHSLCRYGMDLFQRLEDDTWERSFEEHVEHAYTPQELSGWLMDAGFAQVGQFGNLRLAPPQPDEMRIFFAAKKGT